MARVTGVLTVADLNKDLEVIMGRPSVTVYEEYHVGIYVIRINDKLIDEDCSQQRAYSLANRLADALGVTVNAD